jgi:hypothetical protein
MALSGDKQQEFFPSPTPSQVVVRHWFVSELIEWVYVENRCEKSWWCGILKSRGGKW